MKHRHGLPAKVLAAVLTFTMVTSLGTTAFGSETDNGEFLQTYAESDWQNEILPESEESEFGDAQEGQANEQPESGGEAETSPAEEETPPDTGDAGDDFQDGTEITPPVGPPEDETGGEDFTVPTEPTPEIPVNSGSGLSVSAKMTPQSKAPIHTGNVGYFNLEVGVNDPNNNGTADVHVHIPDPNAILPQFNNTPGNSITTENGQVITLLEDPEKGRYLSIQGVRNGATVTQAIQIQYENGVTPPTELEIKEEHIEVTLNGIDQANIIKEGGSLNFISTFYWKEVSKTAAVTNPISVSERGTLTGGPVIYSIAANSYNNTGHGDVYSESYSLTDTLRLPEGLTFPADAEIEIVPANGDRWYLDAVQEDGSSIRLATLSLAEMEKLEEAALTLNIVENTSDSLTFKIEVAQVSGTAHVLPSPKVTMMLEPAALTPTQDFIEKLDSAGSVQIDNQVDFEAHPVTSYHPSTLKDNQLQIDTSQILQDPFRSNDDIKVPIQAPKSSFEVSKTVAEGDIIRDPETGETTLNYTLEVRNTGAKSITLDIKDTLPEGMHFAEGEIFEGKVTGREEGITGTKSASGVTPESVSWPGVSIPKGGSFTAKIAAVVDETTESGRLNNTLTATETGTENSKNAVHGYDYKKPSNDFTVDKSHTVHSGGDGLYKGGTLTYTIVVENTGDFDRTITSVIDWFPDGLIIDGSSFKLDGVLLEEGVEVDASNQTISFPVPEDKKTLKPGEKLVYTYDAELSETADVFVGSILNNTVTVTDSDQNQKTDIDIVTVREKKSNLKVEKKAEKPVHVDGNTYAIQYTVTVRNEGDAVTEPIQLTDKMTGALYPERNPSEDFSIAVKKSEYRPDAPEGEVNFILRESDPLTESNHGVTVEETQEGYTLVWNVTDLPAYQPEEKYAPTFTYTYTAYADMKGTEPVHISNAILAPGATVTGPGPSADLKPAPSLNKVITNVSCMYGGTGNPPSHIQGNFPVKTSKIHSGDKVTYRMTFANNGTTEMISSLITDDLPAGFISLEGGRYHWVMKGTDTPISNGYIDSVTIEKKGFPAGTTLDFALKEANNNTQLVISKDAADAGSASPAGFLFPAGAEITLTVTLQFPAGELYDRHFLTGSFETPEQPFPNTVALKGADRRGETYQLSDHADVSPQPVEHKIFKSADKTLLYPGDTVTFTIRPTEGNEQFFTRHGATDFRIVEDLSQFTDFELISYKIGYIDAYAMEPGNGRPTNDGENNRYNFTLLDEPTVKVPFSPPNGNDQTVTLTTPLDIGAAAKKQVVWDLGDVRGAWVSGAGNGLDQNWPQITLQVKENAGIQRVTNTVQLLYNGGRVEEKDVAVNVASRDLLQKSAEHTEEGEWTGHPIQNDNEGEHLEPGDFVTFTLTYTNGTGENQVFTDASPLVLTDVMTSLGLAEYTSEVRLSYIPGEAAQSEASRKDEIQPEVPPEETAQSETSPAGEFQPKGIRSNSDSPVLISPTQMVVTPEDIAASAAKRTEFKIKGTLLPGDKIKISYQVKMGEGFAGSESENTNGDKDAYIQGTQTPGSMNGNLHQLHNLVYFIDDSGVPVIGETDYYYAPSDNRLYFSKSVQEVGEITPYENQYQFDLRSEKYSDNLFVLTKSAQNFVKYVLVIANDKKSGETLTVDNITDRLPAGVKPLKNQPGAIQWVIMGALCNAGSGGGAGFDPNYSQNAFTLGGGNLNNCNFSADKFGCMLQTAPYTAAGYRPVSNKSEVTAQTQSALTIAVRDSAGQRPLVLRPGEFTVVGYALYLDRSMYMRDYTNSATLNVQPAGDGTGWEAMGAEMKEVFVTRQRANKPSSAQNVDAGETANTAGTAFDAGVSLIPSQYRMSMTKKARAYYPAKREDLGNLEFRRTFLQDRGRDAGTAGTTDWPRYELDDIVEWEITITNQSTVAIEDFVVTDYMPYPHKIIYYEEQGGAYAAGVADIPGEGKGVHTAAITHNDLANNMGSMGKTYRTLKSDPFYLGAGQKATFYVYSYYSPEAPVVYSMITNRAEVTTASGKTFSTINQSNPVYDETESSIVGATQNASVHAAYSASVSSEKHIFYTDEEGSQSASGSSADRTVTAKDRGDRVRYTLSISNDDSAHDMRRLTLIDNLPVPGDYGVINTSTPRDSAFTVDLAEDANLSVTVNGQALTPITPDASLSFADLDGPAYENSYLVLYTNHGRHESGSFEDIWHIEGDREQHWQASPNFNTRVTSMMIYIPSAMKAKGKLNVSFDAVIGGDAQKDEIAWNSFGFRYQQSGAGQEFDSTAAPLIYAEPAKVGVTIGTDHKGSLSISKKVEGSYEDKTKPFTFHITVKQKDGTPLNGAYKYTGSVLAGMENTVSAPEDGTLFFSDGMASIELSHGQQITIVNLPPDCTYTVEEEPAEGYEVTYNGSESLGTLTLNGSASVQVVNRKGSVPETGYLDNRNTWFGVILAAAAAFTAYCYSFILKRKTGRKKRRRNR